MEPLFEAFLQQLVVEMTPVSLQVFCTLAAIVSSCVMFGLKYKRFISLKEILYWFVSCLYDFAIPLAVVGVSMCMLCVCRPEEQEVVEHPPGTGIWVRVKAVTRGHYRQFVSRVSYAFFVLHSACCVFPFTT